MTVAYVIWCVCALFFLLLGVKGRHSQKPMGFWANVKAPDSGRYRDVKRYNRAVSNLFIGFALVFAALGSPLLLCQRDSAALLLVLLGAPLLCIALMVCYVFIDAKYKK